MADQTTNDPNATPVMGAYKYTKRKDREFSGDQKDNKYSFTEYAYPNDLFSSSINYGGNYVIFYINVAEDSRLVKENPDQTVPIEADERYASEFTRLGMGGVQAAASAGAAVGVAGTVLKAVTGGSVDLADAAKAGLAATAATGIVAAAAGGKMARQTKRLKTAIALHVPNQLSVRYSASWDAEDMGLMMAGKEGTEAAMKAVSGEGKQALASASSVVVNAALQAPVVGGFASAASGLAPNPKKEQVFKGVDFRTFQMDYQFFPRDSVEAENVMRIIKQFKYHMHPEFKDAASFIYLYPSEFDIYYYYLTKENKYIHRHTSCVLTEMNVNYTPNGSFTTFKNGMPTQINMQLSFKELAILTKDQIEDGF